MKLKGSKILQLRDVLVVNYTQAEFDDLLLTIEQRLETISTASGMNQIVKEVIYRAEKDNWIIDLISKAAEQRQDDPVLKQLYTELCAPLLTELGNSENPYKAWRLLGGQLFVDRVPLRRVIERELNNQLGKPILVVDGPRLSGKTHNLMYINHLQNSLKNFEIVWLDLEELALEQQVEPEDIGRSIVTQMGLEGMPPRQNEQASTWGRHFCEWLSTKIPDLEQTYWIVIDHCDKVLLPQGSRDLLVHLTKFIPIKLKPHRLVLLGYPNWETLPVLVKNFAIRETMGLIDGAELDTFFRLLYQEQQEQRAQPFTTRDIKRSVRTVRSKLKASEDPLRASELFWEALRQGVDQVYNER